MAGIVVSRPEMSLLATTKKPESRNAMERKEGGRERDERKGRRE